MLCRSGGRGVVPVGVLMVECVWFFYGSKKCQVFFVFVGGFSKPFKVF